MATVNKVGDSGLGGRRGELLAGRYRVLGELSSGAQGEVLLVQDTKGGARSTLKLLGPRASSTQLRDEFARLTELSHPNVVRMLDAGVLEDGDARGRVFLVTEYVAGPALADALPSAPVEQRVIRFCAAAEALADALAYLHGRGILHGDLSPANVRCDETGRPILIDFGLASPLAGRAPPGQHGATGTLGFIAPEALLGERSAAGDLFALGATLFDAWTGAPPFGLGMEAVRRAWQGPPPAPSSLHPGLPAAWDGLLLRLLAAATEDRPGSARELLQEIRRLTPGRPVEVETDLAAPFPLGDPLAGLLRGRADELAVLRRHLEQLAQGAATVSVVCLVGPPGSGRHALLRHALREVRLALLAQALETVEIQEGSVPELAAWTGLDVLAPEAASPVEFGDPSDLIAALAKQLEQRAAVRPLCVALAGSPEDEMLAQVLARSPSGGRMLVLLPCAGAVEGESAAALALPPLGRAAVAELMRRAAGGAVPDADVDRVLAASSGLPGLVVLLVRKWIEDQRAGRWSGLAGGDGEPDVAHLLDASLAALSAGARAHVLAVALSAFDVAMTRAPPSPSELEAAAAGWLAATGDGLPSPAHAAALWRTLASDRRLWTPAEEAAARLPAGDARRAEVALALGREGEAAEGFWQAMAEAESTMAWSRVAHLGLRALGARGTASCRQLLGLSRALGILGRYDEALQLLDGSAAAVGPHEAAQMAERKAWLLGRRGDPEAACVLLEAALGPLPPGGDDASLLRSRLARLLVACGRHADAFRAAEPALEAPSSAGIAARESAVLALAYGGNLPRAERLLARLQADVRQTGDRSLAARVAALEGLVGQLAGRPKAAAESYRRALTDYEQVGDLHGAAAATFNLGCSLAEVGDYGGALTALERAVRELRRLGAATDHALAVFNVGQLFLQLGDGDAASRAVERLASDARAARGSSFDGHQQLLRAELERRREGWQASEQAYAAAGQAFERMGMTSLAGIAGLGQAEVLAKAQRFDEARDRLTGALASASPAVPGTDGTLAEAQALARARIVLADPSSAPAELLSVAQGTAAVAAAAKQLGRLPVAWRAASLAAQLYARAQDARDRAQWDLARTCFEEVKMRTPAQYWSGLASDAEAQAFLPMAAEERSPPGPGARSALLESRLRRLLRINKRLNSELRLSRVLETIIDTVIELTDAERGFLLLKDAGGELTVKVARNIDQTTLEGPALSLSRSIAKQAADSGEPVVTVDAAGDSRFAEHLSVSDLHLRSVLAVPLAVKGTVVGTIYVDHRLRKGVFGEDELAMVLDFADQGAIAIENARVISELRRREQQVQSLNRRLERELRAQEAALSEARSELKETRHAAALRYDYRQIVGQAPAMLELFRLLDRVTDTQLPVVLEGESGTGKELVARAIHVHGPRKDRAFVSENCAAIPETLLESALFGHVRGAFTGAERDTRGLFAVAHGGTLFLDEIADMSPAMQGKLLRVLQDGEYHRVGGERAEKADVRVVVASNQNLARLVEDGKFRKDLFYRLSVLRLYLPPLRERREDIPLLVRHFLGKLAEQSGEPPKTVDAAALSRLSAYAWPGNVRELENEIARAAAFAGATIGVADLSPHVQSGQDPTEVLRNEPDSLRLHQRVERLERQLIREAMARAQGNQTKAAALLGLSRFGLQKKLRRYNLGG